MCDIFISDYSITWSKGGFCMLLLQVWSAFLAALHDNQHAIKAESYSEPDEHNMPKVKYQYL